MEGAISRHKGFLNGARGRNTAGQDLARRAEGCLEGPVGQVLERDPASRARHAAWAPESARIMNTGSIRTDPKAMWLAETQTGTTRFGTLPAGGDDGPEGYRVGPAEGA